MKYEKKTNSACNCVLSLFDTRAEHPNAWDDENL